MFSTAATRFAATHARGSIIEVIDSIRKDIIIIIEYWMKAIRSPTCIVPPSIKSAPTQMISSETPFMMNVISGIISVIVRLTNRLVFVSSTLALSNRFSS